MTYRVTLLPKARKYLDGLSEQAVKNIWDHLAQIRDNPYKPRPLADIIKLKGFDAPPMYRLRVGKHRLEYFVEESEKAIYIVDAFARSGDSDYR